MNKIDLSIIVASYNTRDLLYGCLKSIFENTSKNISFEVIVIDDCSPDDSVKMVKDFFPEVRIVVNSSNLRYAKTNNHGLSIAKGRYGLLLNSDVIVYPNAFFGLVKFMDEHSDVAAAGPKLINSDGSIQHCIRGFPGLLPMIFQSLNMHKIFPGNRFTEKYYNTKFDYSKSQPVESIGTTAFIIRRSTWEKYGMLDERFSLALVDLAYCLMLKNNNEEVWYFANSTVMHYGSQTVNMNGKKEIQLLHKAIRDFYKYYYKNQHSFVTQRIIYVLIWFRQLLKQLEFKLKRNKQVFGGVGVKSKKEN